MDSIFKMISTDSCLNKINEFYNNCKTDNQWIEMCKTEFVGKSVIADWGNKRQFIVSNVIFDFNPANKFFIDKDGAKSSI